MIVYFSEDWFQKYGEQGRTLREVMRRIGNRIFLFFYPLTLIWFSATAEGSFLIPDWIQGYYWLAVALPWGFLVIWTVEGVLGRKIAGKKGTLSEAIDLFLKLGADGAEAFGEAIARVVNRLRSRVTRRPAAPVTLRSVKLADRLFLTAFVLVDIFVVWLIFGPNYSILIEAFGATCYILVFGLVFIGILRRKDRGTKDAVNSATVATSAHAKNTSIRSSLRRIYRVVRASLLILIAVISFASGYFLYTLYNDRSIEGMALSCMGITPNYDTENYTLVAGFNNPALWSFHASWLIFIQANVTVIGGSTSTYYFYIPGTGVIMPRNVTSYLRIPIAFKGLLASNSTKTWELFLYKFTSLTVTLTEEYTTQILGMKAYSLHRFSALATFTLQSKTNNTDDLASSLQFSMRTHFNLLSSDFPTAQLCPGTAG